MKKILFILIISIGTLYAKPCMTDIYFGNGVWNEENDAIKGMRALRKLMFSIANNSLDRVKEGVDYDFKHAYNPTKGTTDDLIETFYQLKESGQITDGYFMGVYAALATESNGEAFINKLRDIISNYDNDASEMFSLYQQSSFNQNHNVLLVAHSQGNLFGNKMYTLLSDTQKEKFRMVSVATPADHVAGHTNGGPYVTATGDYVIQSIPNSLPANIAGFGHTFIGTYLNAGGGALWDGSDNASKIIALHVKSAYNSLMQTTSCTAYNFTRVTMPEFGILKIDGNIAYGKDEEVGRITLDISDANWDDSQEVYKCTPSKDSVHWGGNNYIGVNWTDYNGTYNQWIPGTHISSRTSLDSSSSIKDTVLYDNQCITISLEQNGELYEMIYDMFPE